MKNVLTVTFSLLLSSVLFADTIRVQPVLPPQVEERVEDKIVELHITFAPAPTAEIKTRRKFMAKTNTGKAICSGSFISPMGHIITARHCVADTTSIEVMTADGQTYTADTVAISKNQDLAIIQIGRTDAPFFKLAKEVTKGENVRIIGSPLGLTSLVTQGIVAKLLGDITLLDCTAIPGNSGGPVFNQDGELVGVVSAMVMVMMGPAHISVVQSVDSIKYFITEIMTGKYSHQ